MTNFSFRRSAFSVCRVFSNSENMFQNGVKAVIPQKCNCDNYTEQQKTIYSGICRAVISVISLTLCVAFLASFDEYKSWEHLVNDHRAKTIHSILMVTCAVNIAHFLVAVVIVLIVRSNINRPRSIKVWLILDLAINTVYLLCVCILLFTVPTQKLILIIGTLLLMISLFLAYRTSVAYVIFKSDESQYL